MTDCICHPCRTRTTPRLAADGLRTCQHTADTYRDHLAYIPSHWSWLDTLTARLPVKRDTVGRVGRIHSPSPVNLTIVALTDPRTSWHEDGDLLNPRRALGEIVTAIRTAVGNTDTHLLAVAPAARYLTRWADFTLRQDWAADACHAVAQVHQVIRRACEEMSVEDHTPKPRPVGYCPEATDGQTCGTALWHTTPGAPVICSGCGATWPPATWTRLAGAAS
jgi:hypothetical protein